MPNWPRLDSTPLPRTAPATRNHYDERRPTPGQRTALNHVTRSAAAFPEPPPLFLLLDIDSLYHQKTKKSIIPSLHLESNRTRATPCPNAPPDPRPFLSSGQFNGGPPAADVSDPHSPVNPRPPLPLLLLPLISSLILPFPHHHHHRRRRCRRHRACVRVCVLV